MSDETTGSAAGSPVDWNNPGGLPDDQLNMVIEAAVTVLQSQADEGDAAYVEEQTAMPPGHSAGSCGRRWRRMGSAPVKTKRGNSSTQGRPRWRCSNRSRARRAVGS